MLSSKEDVILFQGDSITDSGRKKEVPADLGFGYPALISALFYITHSDKNVRFINRGVSGDRIRDLRKRWQEDCISLKPTLVSILIGINDCWLRYKTNDPTSLESFESDYRHILDETQNNLNAQIVICEPFVLPVDEDKIKWREDLDPKIQIVRKISKDYHTLFLPLDGIMAQMSSVVKDPKIWALDGVHPTPQGHMLIAKKWFETVIDNHSF